MKLEELHQSNDEIANLIALKVNSTENLDIEKCLFLTLETSNKLTELRSYDEWKDVGRQVMLGQHGLWFYDDSSPYKNRKIYVFDVKQTKGHYRKPTDINYNEFFTAVFELDKIFKDQGLTSISDRIPAIAKKLNLYIKENNNNERVGETEKRTTAVHGRTDNGNGRVSQTRKRTSVGSQLTFLDGAVGKYQQVWTPSDGISSSEQSTEVPPLGINGTSSPDDVGVTGQDRSIYGTTDREPSAPDIGTVVSRELHDVDRISLGNGTDDIHGLHSSVRSGLDESAPEVSENYVLTDDDFIHRTPKERFKDNVTAIKIVKELQLESRKATPDEQTKLAKYVGWGGLQDAFDENNSSWHSEYTELKTLLSDSEYDINNVELENGATVNNGVFFVWNDENATGSVSVGGYAAKTYLQNTIITDEGVFTLTVTDAANNKVSVSVSIVKAIKFAFVVANGTTLETVKVGEFEKTREPFTLSCENLNVSVKKDGQAFAFIVGQQIAVDGVYEFHIYDDIGNSEDRTIVFDSTAPSLAFVQGTDLTENVTVTLDTADVKSVKVVFKSTETVTTEYFPEAEYIFSDWGTYTITATDHLGNFSTVSFEIKKVPPEVCFQTISGRVLNNNDLSNEAFVLDYSEELVIKYYIDNNYSIIYKKGTILSEQGSYHFVITDLANNTFNYQVALDCDIKFSVIVDGQTVKNFNDTVVGKRYFELTLGEPLTVSYSFNGSDADSLTDTVVRFTDEGVYEFVLVDAAQNSITLYFEIDKTAPLCSIDTATLTKSDVVLTVDDLNDIASYKVQKDGVYVSKYILKKTNTFDDEGVYTISVQDYLANKRVIEFQIKRNINYKMSVADGFITNGKVSLSIKESNVRITAIKDGKEIELPNSTEFEFTEAGVYAITISDSIGNSRTVNFTLEATKFRKDFSYNIPLDSQIILTKNGKEIDVDDLIDGDILTVKEDGEYVLTLKKNGVYSTYSFVIDTVVPVLIINGQEVKAGEKIDVFKTDITLASSKKNSTMKVYYNGEEVVYKSTESLSAAGHYKVVITDEVGNVVEYEFDRAFTLNAGAIVLIVACVLTVVLVVFLIFRRRRKMKIM